MSHSFTSFHTCVRCYKCLSPEMNEERKISSFYNMITLTFNFLVVGRRDSQRYCDVYDSVHDNIYAIIIHVIIR